MHIIHIALGGCLTAPHVPYGLTEDTGGHIAYVLGAAMAQAARPDVSRVDIVTRAFDAPHLGAIHAQAAQDVGPKLRILRLRTAVTEYLAKEALDAEIPALRDAFVALVGGMERRPDAIHAHFADASVLARAAGAAFGIPAIYTPHSLGIDKRGCLGGGSRLAQRIASERAALTQSDAVIVSSRDEAERQIEAYGVDVSGQVHKVAPGVTLAAPRARHDTARALLDPWFDAPEKPLILAIARPVARKNLSALVEAYAGDPELKARANLAIVAGQHGAEGAQTAESRAVVAELRDLIETHDLRGRVALPPRHDTTGVPDLYRLATQRRGVFVNPALHEPFGLTLLEAAQAGLPVVATREGGPIDIVGTIGHGTLVDPRDPAAIAGAVRGLLIDEDAWQTASDSGRARISLFDWDIWAARADAIYRAAAAPPARPAAPARALLACDIDGTLTGSRTGAARFGARLAGREEHGLRYVVATGRCLTEARAVLSEWGLPEPDAFITAVGTEIHRRGPDGRISRDADYAARLSEGWDRAAVLERMGARVSLQPSVEQRSWKLSGYGTRAEADALKAALRSEGHAVRVVHSHDRLIDVMPEQAGKAAAVAHLAGLWGVDIADCVAAGDSGNDIDMLTLCGHGIFVGNALPEVALLAGPTLLRARMPHADGVLEGLDLLGLLPTARERRA